MATEGITIPIRGEVDTKQIQRQLKDVQRSVSQLNNNPIIAKNFTQPLGRITGSADEFTKSLEASNARVVAFGASAGAIYALERAMSLLVSTTIEVEQAFTNIRALTNSSTKEFKRLGDGLFGVAKSTGLAFKDVAESAEEFARQGLGVEQTLKRTNAALTLSRLGALDAVNATESLTAALNTFKGEVSDAEVVVNKLAQVDAQFAVSSGDLAEAIKRTGASAGGAKVSFEELLSVVTVAQERTARGGAVIGNAFKTIFTRIQRPEVLNQLELIGVKVRNSSGEILPAIQILRQYARVYDDLTPTLKSNTSELLAGVFQVNVLKSVLPELANATGQFDAALRVANETTSEASDRLNILTATTKGTLNATVTNLQQTASEIGSLTIKPAIDNVLAGLSDLSTAVRPDNFFGLGETVGKGVYEGIGKVLSGPGLVLLGAIISKIGINLFKFIRDSGASFLGLNKAAQEHAALQGNIQQYLIDRPQLLASILNGEKTLNNAANEYTAELRTQKTLYNQLIDLSDNLASNQKVIAATSAGNFGGTTKKGKKALGLIPNFVPNFASDAADERMAAAQGGYQAGSIRRMNISGVGRVTYNGNEQVKKFGGLQQPAIMPPALSQAGREYRTKFKDKLGFDPYNQSALGFVPNFSNLFVPGSNFTEDDLRLANLSKDARAFVSGKSIGDIKNQLRESQIFGNKKLTALRSELERVGKTTSGQTFKEQAVVRDDPYTHVVNVDKSLGVLSMTRSGGTVNPKMGLRQIAPLKKYIDANNKLKNDSVQFSGIDVKHLGTGFGREAKQADEFSNQISIQLAEPLAGLAATFASTILNDDGIDKKKGVLAKALKGKNYISPSMEGEIFEQVARLITTDPKYLAESFDKDTNFKAPFDFEEYGMASKKFADAFGFDRDKLLKADAKKTANKKTIGSIIKKAFSQAILDPSDLGARFVRGSGDLSLPLLGRDVRGFKLSKTDRQEARTKAAESFTNASGFVPNFSMDAISSAIQREDRAGVRRDKIRVGYDSRLKKSSGLGVYNTDEGSLANAIDMHLASGRNMTALQTQGKAEGFVPNFANERQQELRKTGSFGGVFEDALNDLGKTVQKNNPSPVFEKINASVEKSQKNLSELDSTVEKNVKTREKNTKTTEKETKTREKGIGTIIGLTVLGGQISSFGSKLKESEVSAVKFGGTLLETAGMATSWAVTADTVFEIFGIEGKTFGQRLKNLGGMFVTQGRAIKASVASMVAAFNRATVATTLFGASQGAGGLISGVNKARGAFTAGRIASGRAGGSGLQNIAGGLQNVGKKIGGVIGPIARFGSAIARLAGPIGIAIGAITAIVGAYRFFTKEERARTKAFEESQKKLDERIESTKSKFDKISSIFGSLSSLTSEYANALENENKQKAEAVKRQFVGLLGQSGMSAADQSKALDEFLQGDTTLINTLKRNAELEQRSQIASANLTKALGAVIKASPSGAKDITPEFASALVDLRSQIPDLITGLDPKQLEALANALEAVNKEGKMTQLVLDKGFFTGVNADYEESNKQFAKAFIDTVLPALDMTEENAQALAATLRAVGDVDSNELFKALILTYQGLNDVTAERIRLENDLNEKEDKANETKRVAANETKFLNDKLEEFSKNLRKSILDQESRNKLLEIEADLNLKRQKIVEDGNKSLLTKLRSQYVVANAEFENSLAQNQRKFDKDKLVQQNKLQADLLGITQKSFEEQLKGAQQSQVSRRGGGSGFTQRNLIDRNSFAALGGDPAKVERQFTDIISGINDAILSGKSGDELIKVIQDLRAGAAQPLQGAAADIVFDKITDDVLEASEKFKRAIDQNNKERLKENALISTQNRVRLEAIKLEEKLNFAKQAGSAPEQFRRTISSARDDVFFGRRTGDVDRETKGIEALAKTFTGLSLGGVNPGERYLDQLAQRRAQNIASAFQTEVGRQATEEELKQIAEAARLQAEALIKPNKPLEDNTAKTSELNIQIDRNVTATQQNTLSLEQLMESNTALRDQIYDLLQEGAAGVNTNARDISGPPVDPKTGLPVGANVPPLPGAGKTYDKMLGVDQARKAKLEEQIAIAEKQRLNAVNESNQALHKSKSEQERLKKAAFDATKRVSELKTELQQLLGTYKAAPNQTKNEGMVQATNASKQQQSINKQVKQLTEYIVALRKDGADKHAKLIEAYEKAILALGGKIMVGDKAVQSPIVPSGGGAANQMTETTAQAERKARRIEKKRLEAIRKANENAVDYPEGGVLEEGPKNFNTTPNRDTGDVRDPQPVIKAKTNAVSQVITAVVELIKSAAEPFKTSTPDEFTGNRVFTDATKEINDARIGDQFEKISTNVKSLNKQMLDNVAITKAEADSFKQRNRLTLEQAFEIEKSNATEAEKAELLRQLTIINQGYNNSLRASIEFNRAKADFEKNLIGTQELQSKAQAKLESTFNSSVSSTEDFDKALGEAFGSRFRYNTNQARRDYSELVLTSVDTFKSGVKGAFSEAIKGTSDLRDAFKKVFDDVLDRTTEKATSNFVDAAFGAIGNKFGKKKDGGLIQKFARGGMVAGGSGVKDDVPAFLQSGEFVIRKSSVNKYGSDFLDTINRGGISQFQNGGRAFNQTLRNEFSYASGRPTSGSFNRDSRLSAFAIMDSNNPMAQLAIERQQIFDQYQIEFAAYEEQKKAAMRAFKKQQKSTIVQGFINMGLQMAGDALAKGASGTGTPHSDPKMAGHDVFGDPMFDPKVYKASANMTDAEVMSYLGLGNAKGGLIKAFARGGMNRDNVPALLMGGEYVINKQSVDKYGVNFFDGINKGRLPRFQEGGAVGMAESAGADAPLNNTNNFSININIDQSGTASASNDPTDQGASQNTQAAEEEQERNKRLGERIQTVVQAELVDQLRPGGLLYNDKRI